MTAKEYLNQARHLDALIHCRLREIDYWRDLSSSVSGSSFEEHHNPNRPTEAPFVRCLEKINAIQYRKLVEKNYEQYSRDPEVHKKYGRAWKRIRDSYVKTHPFCERCFEQGREHDSQGVFEQGKASGRTDPLPTA